jgi:hypothetical protein
MKHCWNVSTSPRSPAKMRLELKALLPFDGKVDDDQFQQRFTQILKKIPEFKGQGSEHNEDFSARDRIAPMKTYGFVYKDKKTKKLYITPAGKALIKVESETAQQEIWLRQMLKWQFPSPQHSDAQYTRDVGLFGRQGFKVKPFLVALEMIKRCRGLTKAEIAMFVLTKIDMERRDLVKRCNAVLKYRHLRDSLAAGRPRKEFTDRAVAMIYDERNKEFNPSRTVTAGSAKDYADACVRLLRMTGLVTVSGSRVIIAPERAADVSALLAKKWPIRDDWDDPKAFYKYFGSDSKPRLPWEEVAKLRQRTIDLRRRVDNILKHVEVVDSTAARPPSMAQIEDADYADLKMQYDRLLEIFKEIQRTSMLTKIRTKRGILAVSDFFDDITKKIDVFDPPVQLEWNCWRGMLALDHTDQVKPNFTVDSNFQPLTRAPGNGPDGVAHFPGFDVLMEPTLKTGRKQFADETEPIVFHAVKHINALREDGDRRDVYTLAIAPTIHKNVAQYFLSTARGDIPVPDMKEAPLILPITIKQFQDMLHAAARVGGFKAEEIREMFETVSKGVHGLKKNDYGGFLNLIDETITNMIKTATSKRGEKAA